MNNNFLLKELNQQNCYEPKYKKKNIIYNRDLN